MPEDITSLITRLDKLEQDFKQHQHLGNDGSHIFQGLTDFSGKTLFLNPNIAYGSQFAVAPFVITDGKADNLVARVGGIIEYTSGKRDSSTEQNLFILETGKALPPNYLIKPINQTNWDDINYAQVRIIQTPKSIPGPSGVSYLPPQSFFSGHRTPEGNGYGTIVQGKSILVDSEASFTPGMYKYSILTVYYTDTTPSTADHYRILDNTTNTITIGTSSPAYNNNGQIYASNDDLLAFSKSGTFPYSIYTPMLLGTADVPWTRLYVGEDIRLGYGASKGEQVRYIKWGTGTPEGMVKANTGSIYLRFDGGETTTLYVKTSGTGSTGWTAK